MNKRIKMSDIDGFVARLNEVFHTPSTRWKPENNSEGNVGHFFVQKNGDCIQLCGVKNSKGGYEVLRTVGAPREMVLFINGLIDGFLCGHIWTVNQNKVTVNAENN